MPEFFVLTSCTQRKRSGSNEPLSAIHLRPGTYADVAGQWVACSSSIGPSKKANHLYVGRSVTEARATARHLGVPLMFISTGFGLIDEHAALPNYDLTIAQGCNNLQMSLRRPHSQNKGGGQQSMAPEAIQRQFKTC